MGIPLTYHLGVDLGTTYCAAAIARDGRVEPVLLGHGNSTIPTAVWVGPDGERLVADAALRRGLREPERLAREFKRRLGDDVPLVLGGTPVSADQLMTTMITHILELVTAEQGESPTSVAFTHPANWGAFRREIFQNAILAAGVSDSVLLSEPEAAALHYASSGRVAEGDVIAVYDLGGGTFDIALMRRAGQQFEFVGEADGVERLGGVDFDTAVYGHVADVVGGLPAPADADTRAALMRLRQDCTEAKEALSSDSEVHVSVDLPDRHEVVRLNRSEFEAMIRPSVLATIDAVRRVLVANHLGPDDVSRVLLVGGSSRIPLVSELLGAELGRDVAVDTHPKMAVALGAARAAADAAVPPPMVAAPIVAAPVAPADTSAAPARRRGLLIGAGVAVAALVVGGLVIAVGGGGDDTSADSTPTTAPSGAPGTTPESTPSSGVDTTAAEASVAPSTSTSPSPPLVATIQLDAKPEGLAARFEKIWVGTTDGVIHSFDPLTGDETFSAKVDDTFDDVVAGGDGIWVTSTDKLHRIDPATGAVTFTAVVNGAPAGLAASDTDVVVAVENAPGAASIGSVQVVETSTGRLSEVSTLAFVPGDAAVGGGLAWIIGGSTVARVDLATGEVRTVDMSGTVDGVATDGAHVWITIPAQNAVIALDSDTLVEAGRAEVGGAGELIVVDGVVWTSRSADDLVTAVDAATFTPLTDIHTGAGPDRMDVLDGRIWVSNQTDQTVTAADAEVR